MSIQDGRCSGSSLALAERIQEKLERIVREKKTTAACAAVCGPEGLLAAACAGTRGFDDSPARVDDLYKLCLQNLCDGGCHEAGAGGKDIPGRTGAQIPAGLEDGGRKVRGDHRPDAPEPLFRNPGDEPPRSS